MAAVGAGILWLGWNGFNGGDPYYAGADMAAAVVNTNLATAVGRDHLDGDGRLAHARRRSRPSSAA